MIETSYGYNKCEQQLVMYEKNSSKYHSCLWASSLCLYPHNPSVSSRKPFIVSRSELKGDDTTSVVTAFDVYCANNDRFNHH
jgi:hypothetical protein